MKLKGFYRYDDVSWYDVTYYHTLLSSLNLSRKSHATNSNFYIIPVVPFSNINQQNETILTI